MQFCRSVVFLLVVVSLTTIVFGSPAATKVVVPAGCVWKGTSPFCDGGCNVPGNIVKEISNSGDGETCLTGIKVLCCPSTPKL